MRARVLPLLLAGALACNRAEPPPAPDPDPPDPVGRTTGFLRAVHAGDCERVWQHYLSLATREAARREGERSVRDAPYALEVFAPLRIYCAKYRALEIEPVKLRSQDDRRAQVEVIYREATNFRIPGWSPREHRLEPQALDLVLEEGEWRLALAEPPELEPGWTESRRDGVILRTSGAGRSLRLWVLADVAAPVASVARVAQDWQRWPQWVTDLGAVEQVGSRSFELNPTLNTRKVEPILRIRPAADPAAEADFLFDHVVAEEDRSTGFSAELRPERAQDLPTVRFAVYPDPGGVTRLQLVLSRPGGALPAPESIVRLVRALEHHAAATQ